MNRKDRRAAAKQGKGRAPTGTTADGGDPFAIAVRHHQAGQLLEAERLYRDILAIDPRHLGALHYLSIVALQTRRPAAAVEVIGRALAVNDALPECHYNMAFALQELRRLDEAATHYRRATALKPDYVEAHGNLGNLLKEQGKLADALACYERVLSFKPSPEAHYNIANTFAQQGRTDDAAEHYRHALAINPDFLGALNNLANALVAQGKPDEALTYFQRALAIEPNFVEGHVNFANLLSRPRPHGRSRSAAATRARHRRQFPAGAQQPRQCPFWRKAAPTRRWCIFDAPSRSTRISPTRRTTSALRSQGKANSTKPARASSRRCGSGQT